MNKDIRGKKILLVGGTGLTEDIITLSHQNDVQVGVTDYNENTYVKNIADFAHNISTTNVEALEELCRKNEYDGIISSYSDMLSPYVARTAERLGLYVPFNEDLLKLSTDKRYFKEQCKKYGVPVPVEYKLDSQNLSEQIRYPVIIKPIDGMGSRGVSVCRSNDELKKCINYAKISSKQDDCIIEQFIDGDEINITFIAQDGDIQIAAIHDRYFNECIKSPVKIPDLYIYPSRYTDFVLEKYQDVLLHMLSSLGVANGSLFMQACIKDENMYVYEAGMRLNGCKTYQILEVENNFNTQERLIYFALTGNMGERVRFNPHFKKWYATLNILSEVDVDVYAFEGIDKINKIPGFIHLNRLYFEGDHIPKSVFGTLGQRATTIHVAADNKTQIISAIKEIYDLYKIKNKEGNNVLLEPHSIHHITSYLDYDLC